MGTLRDITSGDKKRTSLTRTLVVSGMLFFMVWMSIIFYRSLILPDELFYKVVGDMVEALGLILPLLVGLHELTKFLDNRNKAKEPD